MINAYGYCRFSSSHQNETSIEGQKNAIKIYARDFGFNIVGWYVDRAISGKTAERRPQFMQMMQDIKSGAVSAVLVHKLDRFSRSQADFAVYSKELKMHDVDLVSVMERLDDSPSGNLLKSVISAINSFYLDNLSNEVMKGLKLKAGAAEFCGGTPPLGYRIDESGHYQIEPHEAEAVISIFKLYDEGYTYAEIIHQLNTMGYLTKRGNPFGKNSIYDIFRKECYMGTYTYNKAQKRKPDGSRSSRKKKPESEIIRVENAIPPIISPELWQRVQKRLNNNNKSAGGRCHAKELYLLSGLVYCGKCGHRMEGNSRYPAPDRPKFTSYRCSYRHHALACDNREIKSQNLEGHVLSLLQRYLLNDDIIPQLTQELNRYIAKANSNPNDDTEKYKRRLAELEKSKQNLIEAIAKTGYSNLFNDKIKEIEAEISTVTSMLKRLEYEKINVVVTEEMVRSYFSNFKTLVEQKNFPQIKRFIDSYVERVDVFQDTVKVTFKVAFSLCQSGDVVYYFEREVDRKKAKTA